ncbi:hypothetical protein PSEUDO9AZ_40294 [Pseudomonas sp. 9AZ]|nr:hypothetical protein PSEUDO9AZ_40294 [Pseudomonas sp. 9AZ]
MNLWVMFYLQTLVYVTSIAGLKRCTLRLFGDIHAFSPSPAGHCRFLAVGFLGRPVVCCRRCASARGGGRNREGRGVAAGA